MMACLPIVCVFSQPVTFLSIASLCVGFCVGLGLLWIASTEGKQGKAKYKRTKWDERVPSPFYSFLFKLWIQEQVKWCFI